MPKAKVAAKRPAVKVPSAAERIESFGADAVFEMIADCHPLRVIGEEIGVSKTALLVWLSSRQDQYAGAMAARAETLADDILAISDDSAKDTYTDADGNVRTDHEVVARSRLRVDARKWLAGKMAPKKYGERLNLDAEVTVAELTPEERASRIAALTAKLNKQNANGG